MYMFRNGKADIYRHTYVHTNTLFKFAGNIVKSTLTTIFNWILQLYFFNMYI